jgi:dolichol-phosphate mannosyltransferase
MDGVRFEAGVCRSLSLIIPAYNEQAGIRQAVVEADEALARLGCRYEVLVVDDGSQDGTKEAILEVAGGRPAVRLVRHGNNRGYGAALRTGFEAARFDRVAFTDADCQFDLLDLASLVPLTDRYPLAVGYRVNRQDAWQRRLYSWGYNRAVRTLLGTGVRDCDCALKVFRKDALAKLLPETPGFFVNAEMLARARQFGYDIAETAVRHRPRHAGRSKVSIWDVFPILGALLPFWWCRVLFAGSDGVRKPEVQGRRERFGVFGFLLVVAVAGLLLFWRLRSPLLEPEEANFAERSRQMLAEGRWFVPAVQGQPQQFPAPTFHWLVMLAYSLFGVHDWAARLVSSGSAFCVVPLAYIWGRYVIGARAASAGALMLCLSAAFVYWGRMLRPDGLLCLCALAAWALGHLALRRRAVGWRCWLLSAFACGFGILTAGPLVLVLVAVPLLAYQLLDGRSARATAKLWAIYISLAVGLASPWYVLCAVHAPTLPGSHLSVRDFAFSMISPAHQDSVWLPVASLVLGMLPWILLVPAFLSLLARRSAVAARRRPPALGVFLLSSLWPLGISAAAGFRSAGFVLAAMPPMALALACYLDMILPSLVGPHAMASQRRGVVLPYWATMLVALVGVGAIATMIGAALMKPVHGLPLLIVGMGFVFYLLRRGPSRPVSQSWAVCAVVTFAVLFLGVDQILPGYAHKFSIRSQVAAQRDLASDRAMPVVCYPEPWDSVNFYLRRDDVKVYGFKMRRQLIADLRAHPHTIVFVQSDYYLQELLRSLPAKLEFVPRGSHQGIVTGGLISRRPIAPDSLLAGR